MIPRPSAVAAGNSVAVLFDISAPRDRGRPGRYPGPGVTVGWTEHLARPPDSGVPAVAFLFLLLFLLVALVVIALVVLAAGAVLGGGIGAAVGGARGAVSAPGGSRELGAWRGTALGGCLGGVIGLAAAVGLLYVWWTGGF
jgi:hypothetical protein